MKNKTNIIAIAGGMLISMSSLARENVTSNGNKQQRHPQQNKVSAVCLQTTAVKDLDINNVRARVMVGGDMWWDQAAGVSEYEVPKGSSKTAVYAGSIWVGGLDAGGNIKAAGQTYRQTNAANAGGNDYFAGPIDITNFSITLERCNYFDRHWKIRKEDVLKYKDDPNFDASTAEEIESKQNILSWPGNGLPNEDPHLAPFADLNGDERYDPQAGEYPRYLIPRPDLTPPYDLDYPVSDDAPKVICNDYLFGDQTIWWVFNDVGGIKYETDCPPIGLEVRAQAFAFKTNDEINNMTFYKYQIINRSSASFNKTYFGQWVDADLGFYQDDFVRCNVKLGVGFTYNGDAVDDLPDGYGATPPAIGVDFFQGPVADVGDSLDNDRDGCFNCTYFVDPATGDTTPIPDTQFPEEIIMSKFMYYDNNNNPVNGNPTGAVEMYNYLRGYWRTGDPMTYGANGAGGGTDYCDFMYPGLTDPTHATEWTEETEGHTGDDRRMLQSAGPFTLLPGAVNYITVGVVWARPESGDNLAALDEVEKADKKAQALFDNCFKTLDGPDAPNLVIRELDKELIFSLQNTNNTPYTERYSVIDPTIDGSIYTDEQRSFKFQGYQVYQLRTASGGIGDIIDHPDDIKLVFQCDIKDNINQVINYATAPNNVYTAEVKVNGANKGVTHTFKVDKDLFALENPALVNHKNYYYTVIAYAYNNYKTFKPDSAFLGGQLTPYLAGRNNIKSYSAIPHIVDPENGGTVLNSSYGDAPSIKRIEGQGNGGNVLDFTQSTVDEILNSSLHRSLNPEYQAGKSPIAVKVYDPVLVKQKSFTNKFNGIANTPGDTSRWTMIENSSGIAVTCDAYLSTIFEQVFSTDYKQKGPDGKDLVLNWGISANIFAVTEPGKPDAIANGTNGFIEATMSYSDNSKRWLTFMPNIPGDPYENWIRSSATVDPDKIYEGVLGGTWAPLKVCAVSPAPTIDSLMPKPSSNWLNEPQLGLSVLGTSEVAISSVDIVFTNDQSKWSRAAVIEMGPRVTTTIDSAYRFDLRKSPSIDKNGNMNYPSPDNEDAPTGMGWFPGYVLNLETGERLNIVYGENSTDGANNGKDMKFNPTSNRYDSNGNPVLGGMHYIYVFGHNYLNGSTSITSPGVPLYDGCKYIHDQLFNADAIGGTAGGTIRKALWKEGMWVSIPLLTSGMELNQSDLTVRLRVSRNYNRYNTNADVSTYKNQTQGLVPGSQYYVVSGPVSYNSLPYAPGTSFTVIEQVLNFTGTGLVAPTQNGGNPMYTFNTNDLAADIGNLAAAKDALKLVNVVPNPYYAFSAYEGTYSSSGTFVAGQLDNRIKITNLPARCTISVFTMHGALVRRFIRDVQQTDSGDANQTGLTDNSSGGDYQETSIDWDLKNTQGIPISSGIYLIHVDAGELGKKTLKWFGVLRPIDIGVF